MTALVDRSIVTDRVTAATNEIAAADHLPVRQAHDLVHITAPLAVAEKIRDVVRAARQTVQTTKGCYRVVRADTLLDIARDLEDTANADLADLLDHAHLEAQAAATGLWDEEEDPRITHLRAEVAMLRGQLGAVVDEVVRRRLACEAIGEHPLNPAQRAQRDADCRAYWAGVALSGGAS